MFIIGNMFSLLNNITSHYHVWFFLLLALAIGSQASSSEIKMGNGNQAMNLLSLLDSRMENTSFVIYSTDRFEVKTFENSLGDYENEIHYELDTNCALILL